MYTIKRAAELVGVSESTLRAWDRRYGVAAPRRTEAGYRLYDDDAVRTLSLMHSLVREGWPARQAAEEARARTVSDASGRTAGDAPGGDPDAAGEALVAAAAALDGPGLTRLLDGWFATASFESVVDGTLLPALAELGRGWESGRVSVAGEHLVAHGVGRRLAAAYDGSGDLRRGPRVLAGLPPGARHELGLLSFAAAARRAGLATTYLGADVPVADWVAAARQGTDGVVLAASMPEDDGPLAEVVAALAEACPGLPVAVGGARQDEAPAGCLRLGHEVGPAAALLLERLSATMTTGPTTTPTTPGSSR